MAQLTCMLPYFTLWIKAESFYIETWLAESLYIETWLAIAIIRLTITFSSSFHVSDHFTILVNAMTMEREHPLSFQIFHQVLGSFKHNGNYLCVQPTYLPIFSQLWHSLTF